MNKASILIVEDEAIVAADLAGMLGRLGYGISATTPRGEEAISLARELRPDLVLMDIRLAGAMDGVEAAGIIHREFGLPVIFLTAHSDNATLERAKLSEPFGYLFKPFEELGLETHIEMALYKHRAERKLRQAHDEMESRVEERTRELREAEQGLREMNEELERRVTERTAELRAANTKLLDSRRAALNMMEDAVAAGRQAEAMSLNLQREAAERKQAEKSLQKLNLRLDLLAETAGRLLAADSPQQIVDSLCRKVMEFLDCHAFFNFLVDEEAGRLRLNACAGIPEEEKRKIEWLDYGVAVCGCAARDACRIVAEDIPDTPDPRTDLVKSYGIQAYACHPLMVKETVLGTLSFGTRSRTRFSDEDLALMKALADQVAIAMERKQAEVALRRAHDELEKRVGDRTQELADTVEILLEQISERERMEASIMRLNRLYSVLGETAQAIIRDADRDALFKDFCRIAVDNGGFILSSVGLLDTESGELRIVAACGAAGYLEDIRISVKGEPAGSGPTGIAIREGSYYICNDFQNDPCTQPWHERGRAYGIKASASVAVKEEGWVVGALSLYAGDKDFFDRQQVDLLVQMGADISFALDNLAREARRQKTEKALKEETLERLMVVEALREKEQMLIQQSRNAAMGEMINNIAHQWRQPLNTLGLLVQQLPLFHGLGKIDSEFLDHTVGRSMGLIQYMSKTIDDFRNYFKPDKEMVEFPVIEAIENTVALLEGSMQSPKISIQIDAESRPVIKGYKNEFAQVLLNILINARDALIAREVSDPRVTVTISGEVGAVVVTVADNAGGIPEEIIGKIFDPYFTTKGPQQGTGVGLFMSKTIIEKNMGGRLSVRNNADGAEFRIEVGNASQA